MLCFSVVQDARVSQSNVGCRKAWISVKEDELCLSEWFRRFRDVTMTRDDFNPSELSQIAHGIACMKIYDVFFFRFIVTSAASTMRSFEGQNLATLLWAVATISFKDDPGVDDFLRTALGAVIGRSNDFNPVNLALISWAFAKMSYKAENMFAVLAQTVLSKIDEFVVHNMVQVTWAMATMGHREEALLDAVAERSTRMELSPQHLANLLWAFARFGYRRDEFVNSLYSRCAGTIDEFHHDSW